MWITFPYYFTKFIQYLWSKCCLWNIAVFWFVITVIKYFFHTFVVKLRSFTLSEGSISFEKNGKLKATGNNWSLQTDDCDMILLLYWISAVKIYILLNIPFSHHFSTSVLYFKSKTSQHKLTILCLLRSWMFWVHGLFLRLS